MRLHFRFYSPSECRVFGQRESIKRRARKDNVGRGVGGCQYLACYSLHFSQSRVEKKTEVVQGSVTHKCKASSFIQTFTKRRPSCFLCLPPDFHRMTSLSAESDPWLCHLALPCPPSPSLSLCPTLPLVDLLTLHLYSDRLRVFILD